MTVFNGKDPADCRPTCTKCGEPVPIRSIREDGWIDLEPHACKTSELRTTETEVKFYGAFGEMREGYNDEWVRTRDYLTLQNTCDDLREQLRLREQSDSHAKCDAEIRRLRSALSWIAMGEGRAGWRGHVAHANEALEKKS